MLEIEGIEQTKSLTLGLPQGSVLSPILFNTFIDDIVEAFPRECQRNILLYADDIVLYSKSANIVTKMLEIIENHSKENRYRLNPRKCYYMASNIIDFKIYEEPVTKIPKIKYMGYWFNQKNCDLRENIKSAKKKVYINLRTYFKMQKEQAMCLKQAITYYKTYIRTHLDYLAKILCSSKEFIACAEIIQKKTIKRMFGLNQRMPTKFLYAIVNIETYELRNKLLARNICIKTENLADEYLFKEIYSSNNTKTLKFIKDSQSAFPKTLSNRKINIEFIRSNIFNALGFQVEPMNIMETLDRWKALAGECNKCTNELGDETNDETMRKAILATLTNYRRIKTKGTSQP